MNERVFAIACEPISSRIIRSCCSGSRIRTPPWRWIFWSAGPRWRNCRKPNRPPCASFSRSTGARTKPRIKRAWKPCGRPWRPTTDFAVVTAGRAAACAAVHTLATLNESIREYDRQIEQLAKAHPDFAIFDSLPGAGEVLVPRLIAAFGTQRDRYANAAEIQQYRGIAPVTEASGQQHWVHWRWSCPKFLRQTFHEWAGQSILYCDWAEAYYRANATTKTNRTMRPYGRWHTNGCALPSAAGRTACSMTTRNTD